MTPYGLIMVIGSDFRGFHVRRPLSHHPFRAQRLTRPCCRSGSRMSLGAVSGSSAAAIAKRTRSTRGSLWTKSKTVAIVVSFSPTLISARRSYNLAYTQSLKNSTIPEGGAKGTILPELDANPRACFEKYVDSILDLLIPGKTPGVKEPIVDLLKRPETLFFGPDEGTADMMDVSMRSWAPNVTRC